MDALDSPLKSYDSPFVVDEGEYDQSTVGTNNPEDQSTTPFSVINRFLSPGSMKGSIFTLICSTLGTGLLLIPNGVAQSGIIWGTLQMLICALLGFYSLRILIQCADHYKVYSYQCLADATYGSWYKQLANVVFFLVCLGASITILILASELIAKTIGNFDTAKILPAWMTDQFSKLWPLIIGTLFVFPLSLARELKQLRYVFFLSFCFTIILAFVVLYESFEVESFSTNVETASLFIPKGIASTFPTTMFAFACHPNALDIFKELQRSNQRRMNKVLWRTLLITFATYMIIGVFGFITFATNLKVLSSTNFANGVILFAYGYDTDGNPKPYPVMVVLSLILNGFSLIILVTLCIKPAKDSLQNMLFHHKGDIQKVSLLRHVVLVIFTVYLAVGVSAFVKSIPKLVNLMGSSLLSMICFVFPMSFYIKMNEKEPLRGNKLACWILMIAASIFGICTTTANVVSMMQAENEFI